LLAKSFGVLPRPGGTDQQDGDTMDSFIMLGNIFDSNAEQVQASIISGVFGAK